jgi:8-oxo-dGTP diphosphatase
MMDVVCGVIGNPKGEYLACLRPVGKHLGGLWEFPGGKVDQGENPESALIRELREELEIEVEIEQSLTPVIWNYGEREIRLIPYLCRIVGGQLKALEHQELRWCSPSNFGELTWAPADIPILGEIAASDGVTTVKLTS